MSYRAGGRGISAEGFDWLIGKTGNALIPAYYMMAACAVGLIALLAVIETRGCSLRG
ncbi:hypothetical protein [Burkholderia sp.]|uniref:hypothetical protein n=1 Tax=Burkholderia sp. TaxID=36773 RepID=UPI002582BDA1|nr:hypothetical protein [Burkholderia sp.]MCL4636255.1 hypothetical protein [Burkholderia sp.]